MGFLAICDALVCTCLACVIATGCRAPATASETPPLSNTAAETPETTDAPTDPVFAGLQSLLSSDRARFFQALAEQTSGKYEAHSFSGLLLAEFAFFPDGSYHYWSNMFDDDTERREPIAEVTPGQIDLIRVVRPKYLGKGKRDRYRNLPVPFSGPDGRPLDSTQALLMTLATPGLTVAFFRAHEQGSNERKSYLTIVAPDSDRLTYRLFEAEQ